MKVVILLNNRKMFKSTLQREKRKSIVFRTFNVIETMHPIAFLKRSDTSKVVVERKTVLLLGIYNFIEKVVSYIK
jgi:hypothetical protein